MLECIEEDILPQALMIGVRYDDFWSLNPKSLSPFIKAFSLKRKLDNENMWIMGKYIQIAVGSCLSNKTSYPKVPFDMDISDEDRQARIKERFLRDMTRINSRFTEKEDG